MPSFPEPEQWNGDDPEPMPSARRRDSSGHTYVCVTPGCLWHGKACQAAEHHHENPAHRIRGKNWPDTWPDAQWIERKPREQKRTA